MPWYGWLITIAVVWLLGLWTYSTITIRGLVKRQHEFMDVVKDDLKELED